MCHDCFFNFLVTVTVRELVEKCYWLVLLLLDTPRAGALVLAVEQVLLVLVVVSVLVQVLLVVLTTTGTLLVLQWYWLQLVLMLERVLVYCVVWELPSTTTWY
jgi:hypothetical protein